MRVKELNGKWVVFSEPQWQTIVSRFNWESREYDEEEKGLIPSAGCALCLCHNDMEGGCGDCPLEQFAIETVGCVDRPGCFLAIDTLFEQNELGVRKFDASQACVTWKMVDKVQAKIQIRFIHAWLLAMDSVTLSQARKLRR